MPSSFDQAFERVKRLAADFRANETFYLSPAYQEAEARRDFIDKFLLALGWDVNHENQKNPYEQEVKVERREHGVSQRRADYAFYVAPNFRDVKFYIEAKKPLGDIATPDNYFQVIRYGWNGQTPLAMLFDFEQLEIVDCRFKPDIKTALGRGIKKFHYAGYADKDTFVEIYWLFSREAVANGSLEKFARTLSKGRAKSPGGVSADDRQSIDAAFLEELDNHRNTLARVFKNNNPQLDGGVLTEITQRTLDRFVFIRFLEDNLIEPQYLISEFGKKRSAWTDFTATSRRLDGIYNGIVFKRHEILDSPGLVMDEGQFRQICQQLCHINSPYDFNTIPIHILGSIYERFLGKVIVATEKRARVEEKAEVRKAGGVYYTPEYIVRYIVEKTVGGLIEGRTPTQIAEMRFADIACGSGSFLLGVFDLLIRHHAKFYNLNPGKARSGETVERPDGLHVSLQKKREILLNNIYGVDIDAQAVEVAQLSLYLKLLQDETPGSARDYQLEFRETLLPSLGKNIVCGNSLIGTDISSGELFEVSGERELNPMNFEQRFPQIFRRAAASAELRETVAAEFDYTVPGSPLHGGFSHKEIENEISGRPGTSFDSGLKGGFDAIVGNPPYALVGKDQPAPQAYFTSGRYKLTAYKINLYLLFLERGLSLLKAETGCLGFIIPKSLAFNTYFAAARRQLLQGVGIPLLVEIRQNVFAGVEVGGSLLFFAQRARDPLASNLCYRTVENVYPVESVIGETRCKNSGLLDDPEAHFQPRGFAPGKDTIPLASRWLVSNGLNPGNIRHILFATEKQTSRHQRLVLGRDLQRYQINWSGTWVNYDSALKSKIKPSDIKSKPGMTAQTRVDFALRDPRIYAPPKILVRKTADRIIACFDTEGYYFDSLAYGIHPRPSTTESPLFLIGLLNSKCLNQIHDELSQNKEKVFAKVLAGNLNQLPLPIVDMSKPADKAKHDAMVSLVEQMLPAKKQLAAAQTDRDRDFYENKCGALELQIDVLVFELYGLVPKNT